MKDYLKDKRHIQLHSSKTWDLLYPIYAKPFLFGSNYEEFCALISEDFYLTPEQWGTVLSEWELKEMILS